MVIKRVIHTLHNGLNNGLHSGIQRRDWRYQKAKIQAASEVRGFSRHLKSNFWTLAISTFGIANGLIWYEVIKQIMDEFFPNRGSLEIKLFVAIIVTLVAITGTYVVTKLKDRKNGD